MAVPIAALTSIAGSLLGAGTSIYGQNKANKENRRLAQEQRDFNARQAEKQNAYNTQMWHMSNRYNSPIEQMARLKQAGLNPHLVYGSGGATGFSGSPASAADVKGYDRADAKNVMEGVNAFRDMVQFKNIEAQTNNLQAQEQVARQEAVKKAAETVGVSIGNRRKSFDLGLSKMLAESQLDSAMANARKTMAEATTSEVGADIALQTKDKKIKDIETQFKRTTEGLKGDKLLNEIRKFEKILNENGVQKSDNLIFRWLSQMFEQQNAELNPFKFYFHNSFKDL